MSDQVYGSFLLLNLCVDYFLSLGHGPKMTVSTAWMTPLLALISAMSFDGLRDARHIILHGRRIAVPIPSLRISCAYGWRCPGCCANAEIRVASQ